MRSIAVTKANCLKSPVTKTHVLSIKDSTISVIILKMIKYVVGYCDHCIEYKDAYLDTFFIMKMQWNEYINKINRTQMI